MISGHNALFSMFTLDEIIRSYVSSTSMFSVIAFGSFSHKNSGTGISKFLQMCQWITLETQLCHCVYSCSDTFFFLFSCSDIKHHTSFSLLTPPPPLTCLFFSSSPPPFSLTVGSSLPPPHKMLHSPPTPLSLSHCLCLSMCLCVCLCLSHSLELPLS